MADLQALSLSARAADGKHTQQCGGRQRRLVIRPSMKHSVQRLLYPAMINMDCIY